MIQVRRMILAGYVTRKGVKGIVCELLVGRPERKIPLRIPRGRLVDNIKMDLGEVGWGGVDWIGMAQDRDQRMALVDTVQNIRAP
jgi:hypothetical protein